MDLGSRTKMVNFEPVDATPASAEPAVPRDRLATEEIGPPVEPAEQEMEFVGADWV